MATSSSQPDSEPGRVTLGPMRHKKLFDRLEDLLKREHVNVDKVMAMAKKWSDYPEVLTGKQVQELLQISPATFFRRVAELPGAVKIGGEWRILRDELKKGLEEKSKEKRRI